MSLANLSIISLICNKQDEWTLKGQMSPYYFVTSIYEFVKSMTKCVFFPIFSVKEKNENFFCQIVQIVVLLYYYQIYNFYNIFAVI